MDSRAFVLRQSVIGIERQEPWSTGVLEYWSDEKRMVGDIPKL
jgi:hypothetical protein